MPADMSDANVGRQGRGRPKRADPRRDATCLAIIEAAESLFAEQGIDMVSLRQIGAAAGAKNTAVVAYHFGDKEALIEAILRHRLPEFEKRRGELAGPMQGRGLSLEDTLRVLWQPLFEQRNAQGRRSYAAFLLNLGRSRWGWVWMGAGLDVPVTLELGRTIRNLMPAGAQKRFSERMIATTALVMSVLEAAGKSHGAGPETDRELFEDAVRMASAALRAPGA
ncbi:TetR/AcrR family transcriptional regulator [Novosphingobium album (ex Hu et al. 2023)]|uniref:TetR/AcrR family transcriptional regulator n=1 Tax=Novosphingobium album (ex Hu et al. 2023) TaxID=2930093 RepID=A0ABT0AYZ8_9SPHN|nr:TetR/AcrR family transcriptional regulator [Novosphingobium album (ex Hu et al. 2023)]MCJ2178031.1 TetR/AcrR family transcriptional regulator [Novosphingobium album (ex Hu et al. 2023)]